MSANDLLTILAEAFFILLGVITVVDYYRHRDVTRRDIAVTFSVLALPFLARVYENFIGQRFVWLDQLGLIALLSQPYLTLRLARYYYPTPALLMRVALLGMIISWVAIIVLAFVTAPLSSILFIALTLYFTSVNAYGMSTFVRGALRTSGVVRQRLRFAAAGSGLLVLTLLVLAVASVVPALKIVTPLALLCGIGASLSYYLGFAPPRWLRRALQYSELRGFLTQRSMMSTGERLNVTQALSELCTGANRSVGGVVSAVIQQAENKSQWSFRYITDHPELVDQTYPNSNMLQQAWESHKPLAFRATDGNAEADRHLLEMFDAKTVIIAPIATEHHNWGLLLVFSRHSPLFIQDDLAMVTILARQSAIFLENGTLVEALYSDSARLKQEVEQSSVALEQTRLGYQRIVETAHEGIWETDKDFNTTFVNARLAEMLGYSVEELMNSPTTRFLDTETQNRVGVLRQRRVQGVREQVELRFRRKDGSPLIVLSSSTPQFDDNGAYKGSLAMLADITDLKVVENQIRQLNTDLEQRVMERTAQLSAVNRELEAFSYSVSHDLRAPLRALDGYSQILIEDYSERLDSDGLKYLERIRAGSQRMGQLIDAMLQLSRLTRVDMQIESINLSQMAHSIKDELIEQFPERQIDFRIQDGIVVKGDERLLRVALTNLLNNAWKFTSTQEHPCIEFGQTPEEARDVYFVRDNGVGFDMAYSNKLFGAFQRLHGFNEFEGTGIGLATVERIIHRHSGKIWADAALNEGATFYFTVPD